MIIQINLFGRKEIKKQNSDGSVSLTLCFDRRGSSLISMHLFKVLNLLKWNKTGKWTVVKT